MVVAMSGTDVSPYTWLGRAADDDDANDDSRAQPRNMADRPALQVLVNQFHIRRSVVAFARQLEVLRSFYTQDVLLDLARH
jgi:hypothetical protein